MKSTTSKRKKSLARLLLIVETTVILVALAFFLLEYWEVRKIDPLYANSYYPPVAEAIVGSFAIAIASAILVDRLEHEITESS